MLGGEEERSRGLNNRVLSSSSSSSSSKSSSISSSSSFSPSTFQPNPRPKTMEEVWKDINLASLHDHSSIITDNVSDTTHNFRGMIFQDFLGVRPPFGKDPPTTQLPASAASRSPPARPPPATVLSLNSGPEFQFLSNSDPLLGQNLIFQPQPISNVCSLSVPFEALAASSNLPAFGKKRFPESDNNSGDRRHKRMIKNRESAARSRARKQAYTNELELEVAHLMEENARLKQQQQQICLAAANQPPKKHTLQRTSTAPF